MRTYSIGATPGRSAAWAAGARAATAKLAVEPRRSPFSSFMSNPPKLGSHLDPVSHAASGNYLPSLRQLRKLYLYQVYIVNKDTVVLAPQPLQIRRNSPCRSPY